MHIWAATHAWSQLCLGGPISLPEAGWESVETLRHVRRSRSSWCVSTCQREAALLAVAMVLCTRWLEDLWEREWQCHFCLWVYTVTQGHSGLNWLFLGKFQTLPPSFHRKAFIMTGYFQSTTDTFSHRKESMVPFPEDIKIGFSLAESFMWAESLWHQSILTEEKNHLPAAIWRILMLKFSLVMNFTAVIWILNLLSSQRLKLL